MNIQLSVITMASFIIALTLGFIIIITGGLFFRNIEIMEIGLVLAVSGICLGFITLALEARGR